MDGDKQVGLGLVGYAGTLGQRDIDIGGAGVKNFNIRVVVLNQLSQFQSHLQREGLLLTFSTHSTRFVASVPCVYHHSFHLSGLFFLRKNGAINAGQHNKKAK